MKNHLVLHIDTDFIAAIVLAGNGRSYPIKNGNEELLWMYFFNDPRQNSVNFGKKNKAHFNNLEMNYYGDFSNKILEDTNKFTVRAIERPIIELLECAGLIDLLKKSYSEIAIERPSEIPTLITFSSSITNSAKQHFIQYLTLHSFNVISYTIPLSELICYYYLKQNNIKAIEGSSILFLKATNTTLHLMKLSYSDGYFLLEDNLTESLKGKGYDPRKKSIIKYVVTEVNNSTGVLSSQEQIENECIRFEANADDWLARLDAINGTGPIIIRNISLTPAPSMKKEVLVKKKDVEKDTGHYIKELKDLYQIFERRTIKDKSNIASLILFGDCFNNDLIKKTFETEIDNSKLLISTTSNIFNFLSIYPSIDFNRYSDNEERIKALAKAEDNANLQAIISKNKRKDEEEKELKKQLQQKELHERKGKAKLLYETALELEKDGKLLDAISIIQSANELDPSNKEIQLFYNSLKEQKIELDIKTKQYKALLSDIEKLIVQNKLEEAVNKYEHAQTIFDSPEIRNSIIELKQKIKEIEINKKKVQSLLSDAIALFENKGYADAKDKIEEVLGLDAGNTQAAEKLIEINAILKQIENDFKIAVKAGEDNVSNGLFDEALKAFENALKIKPKDIFCLDQLSIIDSERKKFLKNKVDFDKVISTAKDYYDSSDWINANLFYEEALTIFPNDKTAKDRISDIGFKGIEEQKHFNALLKSANHDFENQLWKSAKEKFEKLRKTKPDDKSIKDKLNTIKFKLSFNEKSEPITPPEKPKEMDSEWDFISKKKSSPEIDSKDSDQNWDFAKKSDGYKNKKTISIDKKKTTDQSKDQDENKKLNKKFDF
jgi:hypothetical protein